MSRKVSNAYKTIDLVIYVFSPNDVISYLHICDQSIVIFQTRGKCLGFSNTPHVDILYWFKISVVDTVKTGYFLLKHGYHLEENNMKTEYINEFFKNWEWVIQQLVFISSFTIKRTTIFYHSCIGIMHQGI